MKLIETDARSRVVIPGHSNRLYQMEERSDGVLIFHPAVVLSEAQLEYNSNPELRELLTRASNSKTVHRKRRKFRTE